MSEEPRRRATRGSLVETDTPQTTTTTRFASAKTERILAQFGNSPLVASGRLNIVALDAIAERLGSRWSFRRDLVHEHAENVLRKKTGPEALVQRVSDTEYIVAQPGASRTTGQLRCFSALREILIHFLGEASVGDLRVHQVTQISIAGVLGERLEPGEVEAGETTEPRHGAAEESHPPDDLWSPFVITAGIQIAVSNALEPVFHLRSSASIGYRLASRVHAHPGFAPRAASDTARLTSADLEKIDLATIERGIDRLRLIDAQRRPPTAILPVAHGTLQTRGGRASVVALLRRARTFVTHGIICEVANVGAATAASVHEATAAIRPLCLRIIGHLGGAPSAHGLHLDGVGLDGISVRCMAGNRPDLIEGVRAFVRLHRRISKTLFLYGIPDLDLAHSVGGLGITHATLAPALSEPISAAITPPAHGNATVELGSAATSASAAAKPPAK